MVVAEKQKATTSTVRRKGAPGGGLRTYEKLKALIISGELAPGSDLDESELVRRFSVSRTPVREALIRLSVEGLVTMVPSRGAKVSNLNFTDITDHLEIMDILSPSICYLAALRRTPVDLEAIKKQMDRLNVTGRDELQERLDAIFELYTALGNASHNESLSHLFKLTVYVKLRTGRISTARSETNEEWKAHVAELRDVYLNVYNSIESGDTQKAQSAARQWMDIIRERISSVLSSAPTQGLDAQLQR